MARNPKNTNGKKLATQQSVDSAICDIMRRSNCAGAMQYVPELTWILFLRILDERETREAEEAAAVGASFRPSLKKPYRWQDWAAPEGAKRLQLVEGVMGAFKAFVNDDLLPYLQKLRDIPNATPRQKVIGEIKAVNPNAKDTTDKRTPAELLDLIEDKGKEVAAALATLRRSL